MIVVLLPQGELEHPELQMLSSCLMTLGANQLGAIQHINFSWNLKR